MTILISNESFELIIERQSFHIELPHHFTAIDSLGVFEFVDSFLLSGLNLVLLEDLALDFAVKLVCVDTYAVFEAVLVRFDFLGKFIQTIGDSLLQIEIGKSLRLSGIRVVGHHSLSSGCLGS